MMKTILLDKIGSVTLNCRLPREVRVGDELAPAGLHDLALVGAAYGIANRTLGAVSLIGPQRMDYEMAIRTVRSAATELSRYAEVIYGES